MQKNNDQPFALVVGPEAVADFERFVRSYVATINSVDDSVGRLYAALERSGELNNTIFIFASDNGFLFGEHGMIDKRTMHEASIRVPLAVRGIRKGDWKYVACPHGDGGPLRHMEELYNLAALLTETGANPDPMSIDQGIKGELPEESIR